MSIASDIITLENERILNLLSIYLNDAPQSVTTEDIEALSEFGISEEQAFGMTLAGLFSLDIADNQADFEFYENYFPKMIHKFDQSDFSDDPYLRDIKFPNASFGNASFEMVSYAPYEGFVSDDFEVEQNGRIIPQIGFFSQEYVYPTVMEDGRIWMSVTPQEINTIKPAVDHAHGKVLTYGLGLGYFAYMASLKPKVESVTVVDQNDGIIQIFESQILPQLSTKDKIHVVKSDAFDYAQDVAPKQGFDFIYTDLWHDVGDGLDLYLKMKEFESLIPSAEYMYWIEPTMLCYL